MIGPTITNITPEGRAAMAAALRKVLVQLDAGAPVQSGGISVQLEGAFVRISSDLVLRKVETALAWPSQRALHEELVQAADSGDSDRDTSRMMREGAAEIARLQPPKRDREADRARFTDKGFNDWLDTGISDAGHTVWDAIGDIPAAWAGWEQRALQDMGQPAGYIAPLAITKLRALIDTEYMDRRARTALGEWADQVETTQQWRAEHELIPEPRLATRAVIAEYLAARDAYQEAARPSSQWEVAKQLPHGSPIAARLRDAWTALRALGEATP